MSTEQNPSRHGRDSRDEARTAAGRFDRTPDSNPDPITGEPGAHPIGTGVGATAGGLAGAAIGAIGGPIGAGIGAAVGAVVGGLAGKSGGEALNPTMEEQYWRENYRNRPYVRDNTEFTEYAPAYRYGWENAQRGSTFDEVEPELASRWESYRGESTLDWPRARDATRDAWDRVRTTSAESDVNDREAVSILNDLIEICKDGAYGFRTAADKLESPTAMLFRQFAAERDQCALELQEQVAVRGGDPKNSGDAVGAAHRGWINIKGALTQGEKAIINECERGEDAAVDAFDRALNRNLPADLRTVIQRQYAKVKMAHDQVAAMKHRLA